MLRLDKNHIPNEFKLFIWFLMSFQAGYVNVGGFLIFGNFVSHVTGTSSQIGMGLADLSGQQIATFLTVLVAFISGAAFAGHFIGRKIIEGKEPEFIFVTGVKAIVFFLVLGVSEYYFLNSNYEVKLILILLLSLACGIQNATCSLATNGFLKPTHMTGLSTDIGINLLKIYGLPKNSPEFHEEKKRNKLRIGILSSFITGGTIAYFIFSQEGHYGFLFPFLSSICMFFTSIISESSKHVNSKQLKIAHSSILSVFAITLLLGLKNFINS